MPCLNRILLPVLLAVTALLPGCTKETEEGNANAYSLLPLVNAVRQQGCRCGTAVMPAVPALVWNDTLALAANDHATDMAANGYFSHISPAGTSPIQRAMKRGYTGTYVLEDIAKGYHSAQEVMTAWLQSEAHCKAIMDSIPVSMGAATVQSYWVLELGR
jgi:uncharacterized protein YkwD